MLLFIRDGGCVCHASFPVLFLSMLYFVMGHYQTFTEQTSVLTILITSEIIRGEKEKMLVIFYTL